MSFWGETAAKPLELQWLASRKPERRLPNRPLIAVASQIEALGRLQLSLNEGAPGVVIHGPSGSGRSLVARQLCRVVGGLTYNLEDPPIVFDQKIIDEVICSSNLSNNFQRLKKRPGLVLIDALTLHHRGWEAMAAAPMTPYCQTVIVASTAWWLYHRPIVGVTWVDAGLKLLNRAEIEHLANSVRWQKQPHEKRITDTEIEMIDSSSEGLASKVICLAERA